MNIKHPSLTRFRCLTHFGPKCQIKPYDTEVTTRQSYSISLSCIIIIINMGMQECLLQCLSGHDDLFCYIPLLPLILL